MAVTATDVKKLREMTGAGFMDCKTALAEADGDLDKAVKELREKGKAKAAKKAGRTGTEGLIEAIIAADGSKGTLLEVTCNTDFVARNPDFISLVKDLGKATAEGVADTADALAAMAFRGKTVKEELIEQTATIGENIQAGRFVKYDLAGKPGLIHAYIHPPGKIGVLLHLELSDASLAGKAEVKQLAQDICLHIAASAPLAVDKDSVDASVLEAEKEIFKNQAMNEGKPEHIAEKIVEGRIKKFYEESCLLEQPFVKDPDTKVDGLLAKVGKEVGGEIKVAGFSRLAVGENAPKEEEDE